ncbi:MAG: ATP-binding protein [Gammaproteobacteria bacterium]|nr:ATP-binding protein [Gammaproteobacteria bacterium]
MDVTLGIDVGTDQHEPRRVVEVFERFATANGVSDVVVQRFCLALDEILTNVISYGFEGIRGEPRVRVDFGLGDDLLVIRIEDNGSSFNPLADAPLPDFTLPVDERPIGGLGIHLAKNLVHDISYRREKNRNCLTLTQPL